MDDVGSLRDPWWAPTLFGVTGGKAEATGMGHQGARVSPQETAARCMHLSSSSSQLSAQELTPVTRGREQLDVQHTEEACEGRVSPHRKKADIGISSQKVNGAVRGREGRGECP